MNKKKTLILGVIAVLFLAGYTAMSIFTQKELASYELESLKCFGDVSSDMNTGNHLMADLVVRTDLYDIRKIVARLNESEGVTFDNDAVKIQDFVFTEGAAALLHWRHPAMAFPSMKRNRRRRFNFTPLVWRSMLCFIFRLPCFIIPPTAKPAG